MVFAGLLFLVFAIVSCDGMETFGTTAGGSPADGQLEALFDWKPRWRERSDCGRNSLYFYLKIIGNSVTFDELASCVTIDPDRGSSLEDIASAARNFGVDVEILWVNPNNLHHIDPPYLLHSEARLENESGHMLVVVCKHTSSQVVVLDPVDERLSEVNYSALLEHFSGYIIRERQGVAWPFVISTFGAAIAVALLCRHLVMSRQSMSP